MKTLLITVIIYLLNVFSLAEAFATSRNASSKEFELQGSVLENASKSRFLDKHFYQDEIMEKIKKSSLPYLLKEEILFDLTTSLIVEVPGEIQLEDSSKLLDTLLASEKMTIEKDGQTHEFETKYIALNPNKIDDNLRVDSRVVKAISGNSQTITAVTRATPRIVWYFSETIAKVIKDLNEDQKKRFLLETVFHEQGHRLIHFFSSNGQNHTVFTKDEKRMDLYASLLTQFVLGEKTESHVRTVLRRAGLSIQDEKIDVTGLFNTQLLDIDESEINSAQSGVTTNKKLVSTIFTTVDGEGFLMNLKREAFPNGSFLNKYWNSWIRPGEIIFTPNLGPGDYLNQIRDQVNELTASGEFHLPLRVSFRTKTQRETMDETYRQSVEAIQVKFDIEGINEKLNQILADHSFIKVESDPVLVLLPKNLSFITQQVFHLSDVLNDLKKNEPYKYEALAKQPGRLIKFQAVTEPSENKPMTFYFNLRSLQNISKDAFLNALFSIKDEADSRWMGYWLEDFNQQIRKIVQPGGLSGKISLTVSVDGADGVSGSGKVINEEVFWKTSSILDFLRLYPTLAKRLTCVASRLMYRKVIINFNTKATDHFLISWAWEEKPAALTIQIPSHLYQTDPRKVDERPIYEAIMNQILNPSKFGWGEGYNSAIRWNTKKKGFEEGISKNLISEDSKSVLKRTLNKCN